MKSIIKLFKSKTVWVNLLGGAAQIVNATQGEIIPVEYAVLIQTIINIAVRAITSKPISDK